ncbi:MAG: response regulator [Gammaproteobacteria bacterium]
MHQILLVDDEPNFLDAMERHFRPYRQEWTLITAGNGKEALALIQKHPFDLVITDILMPEKEGLEMIRELRRTHPKIRIIAISGGGRLVGTDMLQCARWLGAHQTLEKPFHPHILVNTVRALLTTPPNETPALLSGHETNPVCR